MLRIMWLDDIVRQLVSEHNPPPDGSLGALLRSITRRRREERLRMQLQEEPEVAEEAPVAVEGDRAPARVVEDVQGRGADGVDVADVADEGREGVEGAVVRRQELRGVDAVGPRHEHPRAVGGVGRELEVVPGVLVAVPRLLLHVLRRRRREELGRVVRARRLDRVEEVLLDHGRVRDPPVVLIR